MKNLLKNLHQWPPLYILTIIFLMALSLPTTRGAKKPSTDDAMTQAQVDSLVQSMRFQFEPITLRGQATGVLVSTHHTENTELPLWLLINMSGPMSFDTTLYKLNSVERVDKTWLLNATLSDGLSGDFKLQFVIECDGRALLKLVDSKGHKQLYEGSIYPYVRMVYFKNERQFKKALKMEKIVDSIVPMLTFQINYPDFYGYGNSYYQSASYRNYLSSLNLSDSRNYEPHRILVTPRILMNNFASLKYIAKVSGYWYLRFEYPADRNPRFKRTYSDYCINALNGQTFVRGGFYDRLRSNWRHYKVWAGFINPA